MPRSTKGLGAGSKIPLRGFTQLLKHLDPGVRNQLEQAFTSAENMIDFHSRTVPERLTRRRFSGTIVKPLVTAEQTIVGAFVRWDRIPDPRIAFYEVNISNTNTFASFDEFQTIETYFTAENVTTTKFIRVRGVRTNGEAGIFSETVTLRPFVTAPEASAFEFYPGYDTGSDADVFNSYRYSKDRTRNPPQFYPVLDQTFYADRLTGGFSVWGFMSSRLKDALDGTTTPWDRVRFKLNGVAVMDGYFPLWTNRMDTDAELQANKYDRDDEGNPMGFYMDGGYTASFGPYNVSIPSSFAGEGPKDARVIEGIDVPGSLFYWQDLYNAQLPSRWDQAQLSSFDDDTILHEASCRDVTPGNTTNYIYFHDFGFEIPEERVVTGIEVKVKRRQQNVSNVNTIPPNRGVARPDQDVGDDVILNPNSATTARNVVDDIDILEDVDFGRFLDQSREVPGDGAGEEPFKRRGPLLTDPRGNAANPAVWPDGLGIGDFTANLFGSDTDPIDRFTISIWFNVPSSLAPSSSTNYPLLQLGSQVLARDFMRLLVRVRDDGINQISFLYLSSDGLQSISFSGVPGGSNASLDAFHHIALVWNRQGASDATDLTVYLNGQTDTVWSSSTSRVTSGGFTGIENDDKIMRVGGGFALNTLGEAFFKVAQLGIWNTNLDGTEIGELYDGKGTINYATNQGDYDSAENLQHYFLFFPDPPDIRDEEVFLVDRNPISFQPRIRDDLSNKAVDDESWPSLSEFFYTPDRQYGFLPLVESEGIPSDNHTAIGYQVYGGEGDLWGASSFLPADVNNFYWGFVVRAKNIDAAGSETDGMIDHAKLTLFFEPEEDRSVRAQAEVAVSNQFYVEREVFGALFNVIEIGERLADLPSDC